MTFKIIQKATEELLNELRAMDIQELEILQMIIKKVLLEKNK